MATDEYRLGGLVMHSDPVHDVLQAAHNLWPDLRANVYMAAKSVEERAAEEAGEAEEREIGLGYTRFPCKCHPDEAPAIFIDIELPIIGVVDVLAHELAHAHVGPVEGECDNGHGPGHGPQWAAAYDAIHAEFCRIAEDRVARLGGQLVEVHPH